MSGERRREKENLVIAGVGAVVVHTDHPGNILLVKESCSDESTGKEAGMWSFPAGHAEQDKTLPEAIIMEIAQESGFGNVALRGILGIYQFKGAVGVVFLAEAEGQPDPSLVMAEEISDIQWVSPEAVLMGEYWVRPAVREAVVDFLKNNCFPLELVRNCG